jgi:hypothetical protein
MTRSKLKTVAQVVAWYCDGYKAPKYKTTYGRIERAIQNGHAGNCLRLDRHWPSAPALL